MPTFDEIYNAVVGHPPDQPPSFLVDRQKMLADRQQRAQQVFLQMPPRTRTIPAAAQAVTPRPQSGPGGCKRCAIPLVVKSWGEIVCPCCGQLK